MSQFPIIVSYAAKPRNQRRGQPFQSTSILYIECSHSNIPRDTYARLLISPTCYVERRCKLCNELDFTDVATYLVNISNFPLITFTKQLNGVNKELLRYNNAGGKINWNPSELIKHFPSEIKVFFVKLKNADLSFKIETSIFVHQ